MAIFKNLVKEGTYGKRIPIRDWVEYIYKRENGISKIRMTK